MVTSYSDDPDQWIRETARESAIKQGCEPVVKDPAVLGRIVDAVGDWKPKDKSGTDEKDSAA